MNIYIVPAIIAFVVTSYVLVKISQNKTNSKAFISMVLIFLVHHAAEILSFIEFFKNGQTLYILKVYYVATLWFLVITLIYAREVSKLNLPKFDNLLYAYTLIISSLLLFSDTMISDAASIGYVMTAVKGPLYFLFQLTSISLMVSIIGILFSGYRKSNNHLVEIQCIYMLVAFTPILLAGIGIIALMSLGFKINAIAVVPLATTLFLMITMKSEEQHRLTDMRRFMPNSPERKTSQEIMELFSSYARDEMSYRDSINEIERLLVIHKYSKNGKNASVTAESMGMPRSSLYSIFNRLSIDVKEKK